MTKKKLILILIVIFILIKTHSTFTNRFDLKPEKVYEFNTLPNVCGNVKAGGFSDLYFKDGKLYILTDRGPNSEPFFLNEKEYRSFSCPNYSPMIYEVDLLGNGVKISGKGTLAEVTGRPIGEYNDCIPSTKDNKILSFDKNGIDSESLIVDKKGNYWIGEEYYPSIVKLNKDFKIEKRFAPINSTLKNSKIVYNLPEELNTIPKNRGFEAMTYDGKNHIYVFTQSILNGDIYGRIVRFNIKKEKVDRIYNYDIDETSTISGAVFVNKNTVLSVENRNGIHQIRKMKLNKKLVKSEEIYSLTGLNKINNDTKIEGIAYGNNKLYIINDNDYGVNPSNRKDNFIMEFTLK